MVRDRFSHSDPNLRLSIYSHTSVNREELVNNRTASFVLLTLIE
ncbi:hypothetical protein HMPREF0841_1238 [Streptococcus pyogenes ATCC 10782]|nr:hypothetical protein HMPREF0841_1238 [Streptococcus pyogenes ATCC 10782]